MCTLLTRIATKAVHRKGGCKPDDVCGTRIGDPSRRALSHHNDHHCQGSHLPLDDSDLGPDLLVTSDCPMKIAPSSIRSRAAFRSPCKMLFDFNSHRSAAAIFPCTLPKRVIDFAFISP